MGIHDSKKENPDLFLAADGCKGSIDPCNDQVWHLSCGEGEPPALTLSTTYGLRAYGIRIFPRFHIKNETVANPKSFASYPSLEFHSTNFAEVKMQPFPTIDATLRIWVPTSQVLVGQITFVVNSNQPESLLMEWVNLLDSFPGGVPMSAQVHGVNTILTGRTGDIEPVFLLAGSPRSDLSTYPSLGLELALRPSTPRQITWVLASLENKDLSFFTCRRYAASSLEQEQLKIELTNKRNGITLVSEAPGFSDDFHSSRVRMEQLILPPYGRFRNSTIVSSRNENNGFSISRDGSDSGPSWGLQTMIGTYVASRILLPAHVEILKGLLQNFLDQQADDGRLDLLTSWTGKTSGKNSTQLAAGLALEIYSHTQDREWLRRVFPMLVESVKNWFTVKNDPDQDGFPNWQHLLQMGFDEDYPEDSDLRITQKSILHASESPALVALLFKECKNLETMAAFLDEVETTDWLKQKTAELSTLIQSCWNEKAGYFQYRDALNHELNSDRRVLTYRHNGTFNITGFKACCKFTVIIVNGMEEFHHGLEVVLHTSRESHSLTERFIEWVGTKGNAVIAVPLGEVESITIKGLKKSESISFHEPELDTFDATSIIPFWAGAADPDQFNIFLTAKYPALKEKALSEKSFPVFYKYLLLETLILNQRKKEAFELFEKMFGTIGIDDDPSQKINYSNTSMDNLIPTQTLLSIYGIEKWTPREIILKIDGVFLPPITVQYGQTTIEFLQGASKISLSNGDSTTFDQPGKIKVIIP